MARNESEQRKRRGQEMNHEEEMKRRKHKKGVRRDGRRVDKEGIRTGRGEKNKDTKGIKREGKQEG